MTVDMHVMIIALVLLDTLRNRIPSFWDAYQVPDFLLGILIIIVCGDGIVVDGQEW